MAKEEVFYLKIGNEADRVTVASILYKNGYGVSPAKKKKNAKSFEYYVSYWTAEQEISDLEEST